MTSFSKGSGKGAWQLASSKREPKEQLVNKLQSWVDDATQMLMTMHDEWDRYSNLYQGVQHENLGLSADELKEWDPVNLVYSTTHTIVPIVADATPLWYVKSLESGVDEGLEERMTDALQSVWYGRRVMRQYKMCLIDQIVRGTGFLKVWWNPDIGPVQNDVDGRGRITTRRLGDVDVSWLDPYCVYPDPAARSLDECEWLALANDLAPERAARIYDGSTGGEAFDEAQAQLMEDDTTRPTNLVSRAMAWVFGLGQTQPAGERKTYRVWEVYHEGGRRLTIISGKQVLWDGPNETPGEAFPIAVFPLTERGESFFGMPLTSQIAGIQTKINKWHLRTNRYLRLLGEAPLVTNDTQLGQQLTNRGGRLGRVLQLHGPDTTAKLLDLPQLPGWWFTYGRELYEDIKTVTGVADVIRGLRPGSVQSGIGIQQLQDSAMTRPRDVSRANALELERLGQIVLDMVQERYTEQRSFAYNRGGRLVAGTVSPDMLRSERGSPEFMAGEIMGAEGAAPAGGFGEWEGEGLSYGETVEVPRSYRVVVEPGNALPLNPMAEAELALRLYQLRDERGLPPIDDEALLDSLKFPRRKEVLARKQERVAMMAQGQMAAQGMAQGMGGAQGVPQAGIGPVPQQDPMQALQSMLQPIMDNLAPEDQQVLMAIIEALLSGQELTAEQVAWLNSLPDELQQMLMQVLQALGFAPPAETGPVAAPAALAGAAGPVGLV